MARDDKSVFEQPSAGNVTVDTPPNIRGAGDATGFFGHPRGLSTLFFTEMWERFSYYGIRPLLVLFMTAALTSGGFGFERQTASSIVGIYAACVYLASLPGGWIADRWLGLRRSIWYGGVFIALGHLSIAASIVFNRAAFFIGLVLIVIGTGLLKPNISAIVGDLYPEGGARRDAGFSIFYMGINIGALVAPLVTGYLGERIGWGWGFGAAGIGMVIGLVTYRLRANDTLGDMGVTPSTSDPAEHRRVKIYAGIGSRRDRRVGGVVMAGLIHLDPVSLAKKMGTVMAVLALAYFIYLFTLGKLTGDEKKRVLVIIVLFVFATIFWAAFEQAPTSLNLFARDYTDRRLFGWEMPTLWLQAANSVFVIAFAPVFAALWVAMGTAREGSLQSREILGRTRLRRSRFLGDGAGGQHGSRQRRYSARLGVVAHPQLPVPDVGRAIAQSRRSQLDDQARAEKIRRPDDGRLVHGGRNRESHCRTPSAEK